MDIVAEGVETEVEAVMMTHFGCTELQGFYFPTGRAPTRWLSSSPSTTTQAAVAGGARRDRLIRQVHLRFAFREDANRGNHARSACVR